MNVVALLYVPFRYHEPLIVESLPGLCVLWGDDCSAALQMGYQTWKMLILTPENEMGIL